MFESVKAFSIEDVKMYREQEEDMDFSIVEIWALAEGTNSHKNPFSREVLEKDADTFKGKFIVAKFDKYRNDVRGHELDEVVVGYVSPQDEIEFKTKFVDSENKEKEFVVVKALLSKIYAKNVVDMFRQDNERTVSCEFSCKTMYKENEYGQPIDEYGNILDEENPILGYHIHAITILGKDINPSIKGTEIKVKQFAKQFEKIGIKELAQQRLSLMENKCFSNQELDLYKDKEDTMEEEKQLSMSETDKEEKDVIMEEEVVEEEKEMAVEEEEKEEDIEMSEEEADDTDKEDSEEEKEMGCDGKEMSEESEEVEDEKEMSEEIEQKEFSLDAYVDGGAMLAMLENETEANRELANRVVKEMSAIEIVDKILELSRENAELRKFQEERLAIDKDAKLATIMASVKEDIDAKQFAELQEEGKTLSYDMLDGFANKVKAFAYECSKQSKLEQKEAEEIMRFGGQDGAIEPIEQDVFDRLSKM